MAQVPLVIQNASAPYTISVKRENDVTERYLGFSGGILQFTADTDGVSHTYTVLVSKDGCNASGNVTLTCGSAAIYFAIGSITQPVCSNGVLANAVVNITGIQNADRYKLITNGSYVNSGECTSPDGTWSGSTGTVTLPAPAAGTSVTYTIRAYNGAYCYAWYDQQVTVTSPSCNARPAGASSCPLSYSKLTGDAYNNLPSIYILEYYTGVVSTSTGVARAFFSRSEAISELYNYSVGNPSKANFDQVKVSDGSFSLGATLYGNNNPPDNDFYHWPAEAGYWGCNYIMATNASPATILLVQTNACGIIISTENVTLTGSVTS